MMLNYTKSMQTLDDMNDVTIAMTIIKGLQSNSYTEEMIKKHANNLKGLAIDHLVVLYTSIYKKGPTPELLSNWDKLSPDGFERLRNQCYSEHTNIYNQMSYSIKDLRNKADELRSKKEKFVYVSMIFQIVGLVLMFMSEIEKDREGAKKKNCQA